MTGDGVVLDFRGPFPDGNGIDDLTAGLSIHPSVPQAADRQVGAKVLNQRFFSTLLALE